MLFHGDCIVIRGWFWAVLGVGEGGLWGGWAVMGWWSAGCDFALRFAVRGRFFVSLFSSQGNGGWENQSVRKRGGFVANGVCGERQLSSWRYFVMASRISDMQMNSSALCERELCPGPSLKDGKRISAWSESVGEPKGCMPMSRQRLMSGWSGDIDDECRWKERAVMSLLSFVFRKSKTSSLV